MFDNNMQSNILLLTSNSIAIKLKTVQGAVPSRCPFMTYHAEASVSVHDAKRANHQRPAVGSRVVSRQLVVAAPDLRGMPK